MGKDNYFVEIYPSAAEDLKNIYSYYFEQSQDIDLAERIKNELKAGILGLCNMPYSHPQVKDKRLKNEKLRKLICGEYVIPFLIDEKAKIVSVVGVFHGKMNYQKYL